MKGHTRTTTTRLHPDVARLLHTAACFRITTTWLLFGLVIVILLAFLA